MGRTAARTVRSYMARLRHTVGPAVAERIVTRDPGYVRRLAEDELDLLRFDLLCRHAAAALRVRGWAEAAKTAAEALDLWRGAPLLDVPSQALRDECGPRLEQLRLQALEDRAEADLRLGEREQLIPQLRALIRANPLHERFHVQLMLALASAGQQAEALEAYRRARQVLVDELGVEPGPELRRAHECVLAGDAESLTAPRLTDTPPPEGATRRPTPRQLPAVAQHFVGRQAEVDDLLGRLDASDPSRAAGGRW